MCCILTSTLYIALDTKIKDLKTIPIHILEVKAKLLVDKFVFVITEKEFKIYVISSLSSLSYYLLCVVTVNKKNAILLNWVIVRLSFSYLYIV